MNGPESTIAPGRYRHFKGNEYEVIGVARSSETQEPFVVYRALYGDGGLWIRPLTLFAETVERDGVTVPRFERLGRNCPREDDGRLVSTPDPIPEPS